MKHVICSVRDSAVGAYMRCFVAPSRAAAQRSFSDEVNRSGSEMNAHPDDYVLYELGSFDDDLGIVSGCESPQIIVRGKDMVRHVS